MAEWAGCTRGSSELEVQSSKNGAPQVGAPFCVQGLHQLLIPSGLTLPKPGVYRHSMPMRRRSRLPAQIALVGALLPLAAAAQSIRGVVVDPGGVPVAGVVVQALDTLNTITARALTNDRGEFLVAMGRAGTYTVRTLRIGFKPVTSAPITLTAGEERSQRFELAGIPVSLSSVRIEAGASSCGRAERDSASTAFAAWEQVRTALAATQLTAGGRGLTVTSISYERALDPLGRTVLHDDATVRTELVRQPWLERAPDLLHRDGYVVEDNVNGVTYHAPGLEMLGSNLFLGDHCLRIAEESDSVRLGIAFEPTADRRGISEVRGIAWLDRKSSELRTLEFNYANLPMHREQGNSGGSLDFVRMGNGSWAIAQWHLRMPVLEQVVREASRGGVGVRLAEMRVVGAQMTVVRIGGDTLWARPGIPLRGTILDSLSGKPVVGAVASLVGQSAKATSDAQGRFVLPNVIPGEYSLEVRTPSLDSVKAVHQAPIAIIDTLAEISVRVLNSSAIRAMLAARGSSVFAGTVTDSAGQALPNIEIALPELGRTARTGRDGSFRVNEVPEGLHRVVARQVGYGSYDAPTYFGAGRVVQRQIVLTKMTELESVRITADAASSFLPPSFDEHKQIGLGKFLTRADLVKFGESKLSSVLSGSITSVGVQSGRASQGWVMSKRIPPTLSRCRDNTCQHMIYYPDPWDLRRGLKPACFARVYLDGTLLNPGLLAEPVDVNTIAPSRIEAIEWYAGPSSVPQKYSKLNSNCGVLVIHSRQSN